MYAGLLSRVIDLFSLHMLFSNTYQVLIPKGIALNFHILHVYKYAHFSYEKEKKNSFKNNTWSLLGKQNAQAEEVNFRQVYNLTCINYPYQSCEVESYKNS